jgi:hypothetical protein
MIDDFFRLTFSFPLLATTLTPRLQSQAYNLIPVPIIQQYLALPRKMPKVEGQIFPGGIKGAVIDLITKDPCIEGELSKIIKFSYGQQGMDRFSQFRVVYVVGFFLSRNLFCVFCDFVFRF